MKSGEFQKRFRVNPIEIVIFLLVFSGFSLSLYNLFRETDDLSFSKLPFSKANIDRSPGSVTVSPTTGTSFKIEVPCKSNPGFQFLDQKCE